MTTRAKPAAFARKRQKVFMFAFGVGAAHPGKSLARVSASQVFLDLVHHRPEEPVLFLAMLVMAGLEIL